jgi:DNA-binding CsgD family transcriptional regulator
MRVLRAAAAEAESAFAYATLHRLLHPVLDQLSMLPEPQADALRVAFGLSPGEAPDRFLVSVAVLTLLSEVAGEGSALYVVDDLQWADTPSAEVLAFAARRLETEPIAMVAGLRDGEGGEADTTGMAELRLEALDRDASVGLLSERWPDLPAAVRERLLAACQGNPLALIELPRALDGDQLAGHHPLAEPLPLAAELERVFRERLRTRSAGAGTLLLVAAAESTGTLTTIKRAVRKLGLDAALLEDGGLADLVSVEGPTVAFRHPLVRSAVYHGATAAARREAHRALAGALGDGDADRRAWHLGRAAEGPDEAAASELERSAERTLRRSGHAAAAAALARAAELSPGEGDRARRFVMAAEAAWRAGDTMRAAALLDGAEALGSLAARVRLDLQHLRGSIEIWDGSRADGARLLASTAIEATRLDPKRAVPQLVGAACATYHAGDRTALAQLLSIAGRVRCPDEPALELLLRMLTWAGQANGEHGLERRPGSTIDYTCLEELSDPVLLALAGEVTWGFGDYEMGRSLRRRAVARARALGALGTLAWTLEDLTLDEIWVGDLAMAEAHAQEGHRLALESGQRNSACRHLAHLAQIAALRGREDETRRLAEQVMTEAMPRRLAHAIGSAEAALALLELGRGRADAALDHLEKLWEPGGAARHDGVAMSMIPELVEAAVRAGQPARCRGHAATYLTWAAASSSPAGRAQAARCRALLATGGDADHHFRESLRLHAGGERPADVARTQLLYGEFLRRGRRRVEARPHLRAALETFERLGFADWAERARTELRASGERARRRAPGMLEVLTPQELQIVLVVADGATNRDVAAQLFISPRTVAYHLRKVFAKLGISSRSELIRLVARGEDQRLIAGGVTGPAGERAR